MAHTQFQSIQNFEISKLEISLKKSKTARLRTNTAKTQNSKNGNYSRCSLRICVGCHGEFQINLVNIPQELKFATQVNISICKLKIQMLI
jgi:hypothetical protein